MTAPTTSATAAAMRQMGLQAEPLRMPHEARARWRWPVIAGWCGAVLAAALLGAWGSADAPEVYAGLSRPDWAPSASVFGPVWSVLYLLLAAAAVWAAHAEPSPARRRSSVTLGVLLVPLALWSWCFFAWRSGPLSLACIVLLDGLVLAAMVQLASVRRGAALLLAPLLAWVLFASALNLELVLRNPVF